jgi:hypothetical protein
MKNQNVFAAGGYSTFAVPVELFQRLLSEEDVQDSVVVLYVFLLSRATAPKFRLHVGEILAATGLSRGTLVKARKYLTNRRYIRCSEVKERNGWWVWEICGDDGTLPTYEGYVSYADLTDSEIEKYYRNRLNDLPERDAAGDLKFSCPFCVHSPNKRPLRVSISGRYRGRFICGSKPCGRRGGFIDLEKWRAKRHGQELTDKRAVDLVSAFFQVLRENSTDGPAEYAPAETVSMI